MFDESTLSVMKRLVSPKELLIWNNSIQQVKDDLAKDFRDWPKGDEEFADVIEQYLNFYETQMNDQLLYFTEKFKTTIEKLANFLSLRSKDELPEMVASLLKFEAKHREFTAKTIE